MADILLQVESTDLDAVALAYKGKAIEADRVLIDSTTFDDQTIVSAQVAGAKLDAAQQSIAGLKFTTAGIYVKPTYTDNGDGSVTIGTGEYILFTSGLINPPQKYIITGGIFTCTDLLNNYITANYNAGVPELQIATNRDNINQTTVIPVFTIFRSGVTLVKVDWDEMSVGLANKMADRLVRTDRYANEPGGLLLNEAATRLVTLTDGYVWTGAVRAHIDSFTSTTDRLIFYKHVAGIYVESEITQYNNTQFDNGTDLVTLSDDLVNPRYAVNWIFRAVSPDVKKVFLILGSGDYILSEAQGSGIPSDIPMEISSTSILVGRIIVKKGEDVNYQIDSAFYQTLVLSPVNDHAKLTHLKFADSGHEGFQAELTDPLVGGGTANYIPKRTSSTDTTDSQIYDNGTVIGLGSVNKYTYLATSNTADTLGDIRYGNIAGVYRVETCTVANAAKGVGTWVVTESKRTVSLVDSNEGEGVGSYIDLTTGKSGLGRLVTGDGIAYAEFFFKVDGTVSLISNSSNVFTTLQTGTNHIIIKDNGTNVRITNELGSTSIFTLTVNHTN